MNFGPILLLIILIALNAVFASAEIAVISMNETKLKKLAANGDARAVKLSDLTKQPAKFLATIQVAITLAGQLGSAFAAENFADPLVDFMLASGVTISAGVLKAAAVVVITLILAYFNLVLGELVPKRIAMKKAETLALGMARMLSFVSKMFAPLVWLLTVSTNAILRLIKINPEEDDETISEEEICMMLDAGSESGTIDEQEREMIHNIFRFDDLSVAQICTRRREVVVLSVESEMTDWEKIIHDNRHTYYPVCGKNRDDVIGVLDTKDYFRLADRSKESVLEHAVDKAYYIPDCMKADTLFENMKSKRIYFAVVLDEYGGMCGIVTLHDIVETLFGDLHEPGEQGIENDIEKIAENKWRIQGWASLEDVSKALKIDLPVEQYDTFNGFLCGDIGRVPEDGSSFEMVIDKLKIQVNSVSHHMIQDTYVYIDA